MVMINGPECQRPRSDARRAFLGTPLGLLEIVDEGGAVTHVGFIQPSPAARSETSPCLDACVRQLDEYFAGRRRRFDLSLDPRGSDFEKRVWDELLKIPFGETSSYGLIAETIGRDKAFRAVGRANGKNPIAVIIPCHRVVGGQGTLVGYGGGLWRKEWLLTHERASFKPSR
jgi:methylated-DNA-[protein]-cysteine S-methyltransferase